jgi:hypothetical protein
VEGNGTERKGKERKEGVAELKPNRRVQTSGRRAFRERGENKLVSRVDQSFCFAGHFANEERKKERKKEFIGLLRFDARALLPCTHDSWLLMLLMRSSCCRPIYRLLFMACNWLLALLLVYSVVLSDLPSSITALFQF